MTSMGDAGSMECRDPENEIQRTLEIFVSNGQVTELRVLGTGSGVASGYYDDPAKLAGDATSLSGKATGVYFTLNRVNPELLARATNRMRRYSKHATSDVDIINRDWILVDFDPTRPSGISSTNVEHEASMARAKKCTKWLLQRDIPSNALVVADSGNGAHVLLRIDLPNDVESHGLIKAILAVIDLQFSDEHVKVDVTTGNASPPPRKSQGSPAPKSGRTQCRCSMRDPRNAARSRRALAGSRLAEKRSAKSACEYRYEGSAVPQPRTTVGDVMARCDRARFRAAEGGG